MSEAQTNMPVPNGETLQIPLEIKTAEGESAAIGTFAGYGSVFGNRDRDGDIVAPGAFAESLKASLPALLWQHDQKSPIGRFDVVREDKRGLYVRGRLSMSGRGREAYDLLKMGALNGLSIGFVTKEAARDKVSGARTIMKADLMEVSLVTFPANELARVQAVKSQTKEFGRMENAENFEDDINDVRSFERLLRENGFSRSRAKAITAKGFRSAEGGFPAGAEISEVIHDLQHRAQQLAGKSAALNVEQKVTTTFQVHEGDTIAKGLFYSIKRQWVTLSILSKNPSVSFDAVVKYHFWSETGPEAQQIKFRVRAGRGSVSKAIKVRENNAGILERILGGKRGALVKKMSVSITAVSGSTAFKVVVG